MSNDNASSAALAADSKVARQLGVHPKTLPRWDRRPDLQFPRPVYINGRRYRRLDEVADFVRRAAVEHASKPSKA